jgi:N-acetylglutamate synthase-like GNAT family acetyltransferase
MPQMNHFLVAFLAIALSFIPPTLALSLKYRPATQSDVNHARRIMFKERMNFLSLSANSLVICVDVSDDDNEDQNKLIVGFGQIRRLNDQYSELASLYVDPEYRNRGVGSELVTNLLNKRHDDDNTSLCLLTLRPTVPFYEKFGFCVISRDNLPSPLRIEYLAGSLISLFLGNELVCMEKKL